MAELLTGEPREHIARMWPKHLAHLAPEGNKMGQGKIDPDEGVVCNCGEVLGFPTVQDEADYVAEEPEQPDTSGVQTGEPDDDYQDPDMLEDLEGQSTPGPLARTVQDKADTVDALWNHPDTQAVVQESLRDVEMRDRFAANPHDVEARAYVHGQHEHGREGQEGIDGDIPYEPLLPDEGAADVAHAIQTSDDPPWSPHDSDYAEMGSPEPTLPATPTGEPKGVMPYRDPGVVDAEDPLAARVVVIDPTQPYGPLDVERQLLDIAQRLERGVHYQRYWEEREFAAEASYTNKAARERLNATGGAKDVRDAAVHVACEEEWMELRLCQVMVRAVRETMHNLRSLQTGYQTVARSVTESTRNPAGSRGRP